MDSPTLKAFQKRTMMIAGVESKRRPRFGWRDVDSVGQQSRFIVVVGCGEPASQRSWAPDQSEGRVQRYRRSAVGWELREGVVTACDDVFWVVRRGMS